MTSRCLDSGNETGGRNIDFLPPDRTSVSQGEATDIGVVRLASCYFGMYFTIYSDKSSAISFSAGLKTM
jgi:hypothetical protein